MKFHGRLDKLEALFDRVPSHDGYDGPVIICIRGGLPGELCHASAGSLHFVREPGETIAEFKDRAWRAAAERGEAFCVFGGLPPL